MHTRPMTRRLVLVQLSCALAPVSRFTLGRRNALGFVLEAEYVAMATGICETIFIRYVRSFSFRIAMLD